MFFCFIFFSFSLWIYFISSFLIQMFLYENEEKVFFLKPWGPDQETPKKSKKPCYIQCRFWGFLCFLDESRFVKY